MTARRLVVIALVVSLVACGATADDGAPTTTVSSTATTTVATTTTTVVETTTMAEGPTELGLRPLSPQGFPLTEDETHVWRLGIVPVEIRFNEPGWNLIVSFDRGFGLLKSAESIGSVGEVLAGLTTPSGTGAAEVIEEIEQSNRTLESTTPTPTTFGGVDAIVFDVLSFRSDGGIDSPCVGHSIDFAVLMGQPIQYGLEGCAWSRVWIVEEGNDVMVFTIANNRYNGYDPGGAATIPAESLEYPTIESIGPLVAEFESAITILR